MHVRFRLEGFYIIPNFSQFPATSPRHSLIRLFYQLPSSSPPESKDHPLFAFRLSLNMLYCKIPLFPSSSHSCPITKPLLKPQLQPLAPPSPGNLCLTSGYTLNFHLYSKEGASFAVALWEL